MTKTVSLNDYTYSELAVLAGNLSMIVKKPISLGMAVTVGIEATNLLLSNPVIRAQLEKKLSKVKIMTPDEFDLRWDKFFKIITKEQGKE